jgi:hypothetical protein
LKIRHGNVQTGAPGATAQHGGAHCFDHICVSAQGRGNRMISK